MALKVILTFAVVALTALANARAQGQPAPYVLTTVAGQPVQGVRQLSLSADGRRVLVVAPGEQFDAALGPDLRAAVLESRTGQIIFVAPEHASGSTPPPAVLSRDGQHLFYRSATTPSYDLVIRDLSTGDERVVASASGRPSLVPADLDPTGTRAVYLSMFSPMSFYAELFVADTGSTRRVLGPLCPNAAPGTSAGSVAPSGARISADGTTLAFQALQQPPTTVVPGRPPQPSPFPFPVSATADAITGLGSCLDGALTSAQPQPPFISRDGRIVTLNGSRRLDRTTGRTSFPFADLGGAALMGLSDDARYVVGAVRVPGSGDDLYVLDVLTGVRTRVGRSLAEASAVVLSADGGTVGFQSTRADLGNSPGIVGGVTTYLYDLDSDDDGLHDAWEIAYGLDTSSASGALDPDGDGRTTAQEYAAGTHPLAEPVRYFAEGASGSFFSTSIALFNPTATAITANVMLLGPEGATASLPVTVPAHAPFYLDPATLGLSFTEFSIVIEGATGLVAERRMAWDRTGQYGSHSGTGVDQPRSTWHFAEGATTAGFQTFLLLQNPGDTPATVTVRYLLATGTVATRQHGVPARSRATVWVNQEGTPLDAAEFATTVESSQPIVAERAMYRDAPGEVFAAGSVASGVATPATTWFFAEGATGAFFDTYLLIANPATTPVTVTVEYAPAVDAANPSSATTPVVRQYTLAARSRLTIWVAQEAPTLASTQVSARVTADAPIVAERTMWWPGPTAATWRENHTEVGATESGLRWGVADMPVEATAGGWDTFLLVATTEPFLAKVQVDVSCSDGTRLSRTPNLLPQRTTLWIRQEFPELVGKRCGATLTSLEHRVTSSPEVPPRRVPIVVEVATYRGSFAAGGVSLATRLPD